jgi:hypothetical protein
MTSYITLLSKIEQFCNAHLQIKKYGGEFREQMPNLSTKDEKYPVVFVEPVSDLEDLNTNQFSINVYCVDIIQKDRANLNTIVSDCQLILKDMYVYYTNDMDAQLDVVGTSTMTPINNFDLDYVASVHRAADVREGVAAAARAHTGATGNATEGVGDPAGHPARS